MARGLGLLGQGGVAGELLHCQLHQVVIPALAGGLVVDLLLHRGGGVEQVLPGLLVVKAGVVILHIGGGVLGAVDVQGGEAALEDTAVKEHHDDGRYHHQNGDNGVDNHRPAVLLLLLTAFFRPFGPGLGLFLCTHSCFSPLIFGSRGRPLGRLLGKCPAGISEPLY